jgi:hypothetical protein
MRLPKIIIPLLVILSLAAGYSFRTTLTRPTTTRTFAEGAGTNTSFVVDGLRCRGTAMFLSSLYEETPGVFRIETFASEATAIFTYDPKVITPEGIRRIMEAPIPFEDGTTSQVFQCMSVQ